jgi:hypothetical protein
VTLRDDAGDLHELADRLLEDVTLGEDGIPVNPRSRKHALAAGFILEAAELLLELDVGEELAEEVRHLQILCRECGHDQGDHLVEAPHRCEHEHEWLYAKTPPQTCACPGFAPVRRDTLPDLMTEPAPAPGAA